MGRNPYYITKVEWDCRIANEAIAKYKAAKKRHQNVIPYFAQFNMVVELQSYIVEPKELLIFLWRKLEKVSSFELVFPFPLLSRKYVSHSKVSVTYDMHISVGYKSKEDCLCVTFQNGTRNVIEWAYDGTFLWLQEGIPLPPFKHDTFVVNKIVKAVDKFIEYAQICHESY